METIDKTINIVSKETMKNINEISKLTNLVFIPVSIDYMYTEKWDVKSNGATVLCLTNSEIDNFEYLLKKCIPHAIDRKETIDDNEFWDIILNYNPYYERASIAEESFKNAIRLHRLSSLMPNTFNLEMNINEYFKLYEDFSNDWHGDYDLEYLDFGTRFYPIGGSFNRTKKEALECKFRIKFELSNFTFRSVNIGTISFFEYNNISRSGKSINLGEKEIEVLAKRFFAYFNQK